MQTLEKSSIGSNANDAECCIGICRPKSEALIQKVTLLNQNKDVQILQFKQPIQDLLTNARTRDLDDFLLPEDHHVVKDELDRLSTVDYSKLAVPTKSSKRGSDLKWPSQHKKQHAKQARESQF